LGYTPSDWVQNGTILTLNSGMRKKIRKENGEEPVAYVRKA